jgi:hypothetical protein
MRATDFAREDILSPMHHAFPMLGSGGLNSVVGNNPFGWVKYDIGNRYIK